MVSTIVKKLKSSKFLYSLYYYIGTFSASLAKLFLSTDDRLILFVSYGGRKFEDSPKDIYDWMLKDDRFKDYRLVWAFIDPSKYILERGEKVCINSIRYIMLALKARVWITNVNMKRGLGFAGKHTLSINSWHGTAIKHIGIDSVEGEEFVSKDKYPLADIMLAQSDYDVDIFSRAFELRKDQVLKTGFPRTDGLIRDNSQDNIISIKKKLGIPLNKKVIMYAPTFRERKGVHSWEQKSPLNLKKWEEALGNQYILIIRAHQIVEKMLGVEENDFVFNFSGYPILNDLLLVTDILISDYSGILFDFAVLDRPIICYAYDYDQYVKDRGVYFDVRNELFTESNEDSLINTISSNDVSLIMDKTLQFKKRYVQIAGGSSERVVDIIYNALHN